MTNQLVHEYKPQGAARYVFECRDPEVLLSGPAGTGKSRACLEKLHMVALMNPGMRGLIVRKTLVSLGSTALVTWRKFVANEAIQNGDVWFYGGSPQEPAGYKYANGSFIAIGGMDKSTKIMSSEYDMIYVQEATELTITDWEALTTRLRNWVVSFQQLIADCNPDMPTHWLKARSDRRATTMLESRHEDNPLLFRAGEVTPEGVAYIGKLDALTGVRYDRLRRGIWSAAEGLVFENYDPAVHLIDRFDIPYEWARWWSVDFGYTNPFVLQCWAEDPDGRLYLYREIYHTRRLVEDHARQILSIVNPCWVCCESTSDGHVCQECRNCKCKWIEPEPRAVICDHNAEDRATLSKYLGMSTRPAIKTVSNGLQAVSARHKTAGDGRPRVFLLRDSVVERDKLLSDAKLPTCTDEEIVGYVWDESAGGKMKEVPKKENDHGMDAKRYMVAERDLGARSGVRFLGGRR